MGRKELQSKMTVLLGGYAAEVLIFDENSTGAQDDIAKNTYKRTHHGHSIRDECRTGGERSHAIAQRRPRIQSRARLQ